jgi:hypothetical protein
MAAQTGDPMAGPKAIAELDYMRKKAAPTNADELNLLRIKHMNEADERARIDREAKEAARKIAADPTKSMEERTSALISVGDYTGVSAIQPPKAQIVEKRLPNGQVQKVWVDPSTRQELGPFEEGGVSRWKPEGSEVVMGPDGPIYAKGAAALKLTGPQINRAGERTAQSMSVSDAMQLYPIVTQNPALQARSGIAQAGAKAVGVVSPETAGAFRKWLTNGATPDEQALYNRVVESSAGIATHIINKGGTTENDIARAKNMLSQTSDPETFRSALKDSIVMTVRSQNYDARDTGEQPDYDIRSDSDMLRLKADLEHQGFSSDDVRKIITETTEPMPRWNE